MFKVTHTYTFEFAHTIAPVLLPVYEVRVNTYHMQFIRGSFISV